MGVFIVGVLCLEIVSGRRNIHKRLSPDLIYINDGLHEQGKLLNIFNPRLVSQSEGEKAEVPRLMKTYIISERSGIQYVVAMLLVVVHQGMEIDQDQELSGTGNNHLSSVRKIQAKPLQGSHVNEAY